MVKGMVGTMVAFISPTTRMLAMSGLMAMAPLAGHAAKAPFALTSARPVAPAVVNLRKSRRCFSMNASFSETWMFARLGNIRWVRAKCRVDSSGWWRAYTG